MYVVCRFGDNLVVGLLSSRTIPRSFNLGCNFKVNSYGISLRRATGVINAEDNVFGARWDVERLI